MSQPALRMPEPAATTDAGLAQSIATLASMPDFIADLLAEIPAGQLARKPKAGADYFSVLEQICHLRDIEIEGYAVRLRRILLETRPELPGIDGGQLASERNYLAQGAGSAFAAFLEAREKNMSRLRTLIPQELERTALLGGTGEITLEQMIAMWVEHDMGHRGELAALAEEIRNAAA